MSYFVGIARFFIQINFTFLKICFSIFVLVAEIIIFDF